MAKELVFLIPVTDTPMPVDWDNAKEANFKISDLKSSPSGDFAYGELPTSALKAKNYSVWEKDFENWLVRTQKLQLFKSVQLNELSMPEETERDFRIRLQQVAREKRDEHVEKIREKYRSTFDRLDERLRKAKMNLENQRAQSKSQKVQVAVSIGETLFGSFLGRKSSTRATRSAREIARQRKEARDQKNAEENLKVLENDREQLEKQFQSEVALTETKSNSLSEALAKVFISPSKADVTVRLLALAWTL